MLQHYLFQIFAYLGKIMLVKALLLPFRSPCTIKYQGLPVLQDVIAFAKSASEALDVYDAYMGVFVNFPDIPWRRSALAFLLGIVQQPSRSTLSMKFTEGRSKHA